MKQYILTRTEIYDDCDESFAILGLFDTVEEAKIALQKDIKTIQNNPDFDGYEWGENHETLHDENGNAMYRSWYFNGDDEKYYYHINYLGFRYCQ